ncbi:acyl carrier protein [Micromonospora sp. ATCC 39149]|uniref:Acyl carrier protein n=1 Tax=Micromonospora carbonacea TaxID=47853 RepID=A0A7D5YC01_9ACTN|nr:phosphopantetheine-binding protein [Micromonospora sp. ATCC 39149]EEP74798.1 acyl carrier protein [Micromonospora sp. ATCC 39149]QLK00581.1 acyl carrier protein [Micromonospora carbonacea]
MWDNRFAELLRGHLPFLSPDEPLEQDARLRDFGLDSLATVELLAELEREYQVHFADQALSLETFATPAILWKTLSGLTGAAE